MIPNLKMGYCHQREDLERPCGVQMGEKLGKKSMKEPMDGFEDSAFFASKTYSILSYIVGGFVGSKSQMNNNKHNLSYDLRAAVFNLLNPCKYEREKGNFRKNTENSLYNAATKISAEAYDKYIIKSSQKENNMIDLALKWFSVIPLLKENFIHLEKPFYDSTQTRNDSSDCDTSKCSSDEQITMENSKLENCINNSVDVTDRVSSCGGEILVNECLNHSVNYLATKRFRQQSECSVDSTDSESFIIFDNTDHEDEKNSDTCLNFEIYDLDSEDGNDDGGDNDSSCEFDICSVDKELAEANEKWWRNYEDVETQQDEGQRKVRFNDDVKINKIVAWEYAYRAARPGPWEQMARDRVRFRERILRLSPTISPVLRKEHREKIFKELYS